MTKKQNWLKALETACAESSQKAVATRMGVSVAAVSRLLAGTYEAGTARMEERVRKYLIKQSPCCPHIAGKLRACETCHRRETA